MCSSSGCDIPGLASGSSMSKCDMAGLINGPVGSIVGIGIKALMNGAPIGPRSAEASRKPTEKENIQQFYDNVEAHLNGALKILTPALEIKKILTGECKSAEPERSALTPSTKIVYYSPQNQAKSQSACSSRCCCQKKSATETTDKWSSARTSKTHGDKSRAEITAKSGSSSSLDHKRSKKNSEKSKCSPCFAGETSSSISSNSRHDSRGKSTGDSAKSLRSNKQAKCCICKINLKDNSLLAVLPCEHSFCYTCLAKGKNFCQNCEKSFDMKNITQIFFKRT